ncbi:MAG: PIN domain-containing protein [Peptococcaceae bacterium]|nr:MAG: PIN domain-containing protein [Peptococcaceae bacterium]
MEVKDLYNKLFVDTGAFIALIDENDPLHQKASAFYTSLTKRTRLLTTLLVVSETYTWLRYHAGYNHAVRYLGIIEKAEKTGSLKVIIPDDDVKSKAYAVLKKYRDQALSYVDAVSFIILDTTKITEVFGFDSHFYIIKQNLWPSG